MYDSDDIIDALSDLSSLLKGADANLLRDTIDFILLQRAEIHRRKRGREMEVPDLPTGYAITHLEQRSDGYWYCNISRVLDEVEASRGFTVQDAIEAAIRHTIHPDLFHKFLRKLVH